MKPYTDAFLALKDRRWLDLANPLLVCNIQSMLKMQQVYFTKHQGCVSVILL